MLGQNAGQINSFRYMSDTDQTSEEAFKKMQLIKDSSNFGTNTLFFYLLQLDSISTAWPGAMT